MRIHLITEVKIKDLKFKQDQNPKPSKKMKVLSHIVRTVLYLKIITVFRKEEEKFNKYLAKELKSLVTKLLLNHQTKLIKPNSKAKLPQRTNRFILS